ncbi:mechanosensitive ion channel protein [Plasmodium brasilianum]|uniref:Mechanosensitive ion channel protein, putative n=2 Tax=Plasmodium (Plasmodium) TaxID=418103 RepID=A0A1A8W1Z8_PLAMA|nr:mechanosensitive ion channel protein, putative [Plasmodium malariae]KAI4838212.1 mechanosensitive ion channel protein [Plasmodium brasilianum]SBS85171.1 conserved Plasmodium protein, unknown function [Plasmodium malariae]SCN12607.1 mechanosensitive ion channel protein, putative [Plasmodium malariae]
MSYSKDENYKGISKSKYPQSLIMDVSRSYMNKQDRINAVNLYIQKSSYNAQFLQEDEEEEDESESETLGDIIIRILSIIFPDLSPWLWFVIHFFMNLVILCVSLSSLSEPNTHDPISEPKYNRGFIFGSIYCSFLILSINIASFSIIMIIHALVQKIIFEKLLQPSALCAAFYNTVDPELVYLLWSSAQIIYWRSNMVLKNGVNDNGNYYVLRIFGYKDEQNPFIFLNSVHWLITFPILLYIVFAARLLFLSIISFIFELGFLMNAHDLLGRYLRKYGILRKFNIEWFMFVADKQETIRSLFGYELYQDERIIRQIETNDISKKFIQEKAELLLFKNLPRNCTCCKITMNNKNKKNAMKLLLPPIFEAKNIVKSETSSIKNWLACHYVVNTSPLIFLLNNSIALTNKNAVKSASEILFRQVIMSLKMYYQEKNDTYAFTGTPMNNNISSDEFSPSRNMLGLHLHKTSSAQTKKSSFLYNNKNAINKLDLDSKAHTKINLENIFNDIDQDAVKCEDIRDGHTDRGEAQGEAHQSVRANEPQSMNRSKSKAKRKFKPKRSVRNSSRGTSPQVVKLEETNENREGSKEDNKLAMLKGKQHTDQISTHNSGNLKESGADIDDQGEHCEGNLGAGKYGGDNYGGDNYGGDNYGGDNYGGDNYGGVVRNEDCEQRPIYVASSNNKRKNAIVKDTKEENKGGGLNNSGKAHVREEENACALNTSNVSNVEKTSSISRITRMNDHMDHSELVQISNTDGRGAINAVISRMEKGGSDNDTKRAIHVENFVEKGEGNIGKKVDPDANGKIDKNDTHDNDDGNDNSNKAYSKMRRTQFNIRITPSLSGIISEQKDKEIHGEKGYNSEANDKYAFEVGPSVSATAGGAGGTGADINNGKEERNFYPNLENYKSMKVQIKDLSIEDVLKKKYTSDSLHNREMERKENGSNDEGNGSDVGDRTDGGDEVHVGFINKGCNGSTKGRVKKCYRMCDYEESGAGGGGKNSRVVFNKEGVLGSSLLPTDREKTKNKGSNIIIESTANMLNDTNNKESTVRDANNSNIMYYPERRKKNMVNETSKISKKMKNKGSGNNKNTYFYHSHLLNEEMNLLERSDAINVKRLKENKRMNIRSCLCLKRNKKERFSRIKKDISLEIDDPFIMNVTRPMQLNINGNEYVTKDMIEVFLKPEDADEFMKEFDLSGHGKIDIIMFRNAVMRAITCRKKFIKSLKGQESILKLVRRLMSILLSFLASVVLLFIFGVSADTIIVTGAAFITAVTVILSYMYTNFITSVIFIAFSNPYNIGDRIRLDGGEAMYIKKIKTYTTEFETTTGKIVIYENSKLSNAKIYNESRSKNAYIDIAFKVDINTPLLALKELRKSLQFLVDSRPSDFCKTKNLYFGYSLQPGHFYEISFWIKCVEGWGNWRKVFELRTDIYDFIILQLRLLNISYRLPTQKVGFTAPLNIIDTNSTHNNSGVNNNINTVNSNVNSNVNNNINNNNLKINRNKQYDYSSPPKEGRNQLFMPSARHKREFGSFHYEKSGRMFPQHDKYYRDNDNCSENRMTHNGTNNTVIRFFKERSNNFCADNINDYARLYRRRGRENAKSAQGYTKNVAHEWTHNPKLDLHKDDEFLKSNFDMQTESYRNRCARNNTSMPKFVTTTAMDAITATDATTVNTNISTNHSNELFYSSDDVCTLSISDEAIKNDKMNNPQNNWNKCNRNSYYSNYDSVLDHNKYNMYYAAVPRKKNSNGYDNLEVSQVRIEQNDIYVCRENTVADIIYPTYNSNINDDIAYCNNARNPPNTIHNYEQPLQMNDNENDDISYDSSSGYDSFECVKHFSNLHNRNQRFTNMGNVKKIPHKNSFNKKIK